MTLLPPGVKVHLAYGHTDMRKGMDSLAVLVQEVLQQDPFSGHLFVFRGRKANLIKIVFWASASSRVSFFGRLTSSPGEPCRSPPLSCRLCSRGSTGVLPSADGGPPWPGERLAADQDISLESMK
jgi:hypothetical protein